MKKDDSVYLRHMLDATADIQEFVKDMQQKDFELNKPTKYAVVRCIEIIGEASKRLSTEFKEKHKDIPWRDIAGMRDKIIHDYIGVDYRTVWQVAQRHVPELKKKLKSILKEIG